MNTVIFLRVITTCCLEKISNDEFLAPQGWNNKENGRLVSYTLAMNVFK
jgi:hypothetical protein